MCNVGGFSVYLIAHLQYYFVSPVDRVVLHGFYEFQFILLALSHSFFIYHFLFLLHCCFYLFLLFAIKERRQVNKLGRCWLSKFKVIHCELLLAFLLSLGLNIVVLVCTFFVLLHVYLDSRRTLFLLLHNLPSDLRVLKKLSLRLSHFATLIVSQSACLTSHVLFVNKGYLGN